MRKDSYENALKLERKRAWAWRQSEQGKFESSMLSLNALAANIGSLDNIAAISDGGAGVERIAAHEDERERERRIAAALSLLSVSDRRFAEEILRGKSWRDLEFNSRQALNQRLDRLIQKMRKNRGFGKL